MADLPACPPSLKQIAHFLKAAQEHDDRDLVVAYWCRIYALQSGLKLSSKKPEETGLLIAIMDWLEKTKKANHDNEAITNEVVAQAHLENYALKLYSFADQQDRAAIFNKNVVKAYYTAGIIYDVLQTFGELSEETVHNRKYAKYKAAYIHNCLKNGETPIPGPHGEDGGSAENKDDNEDVVIGGPPAAGGSSDRQPPPNSPPPSDEPSTPQSPHIEFKPHPNPSAINADVLPSPPEDPEDKNPGGFKPYVPVADPIPKYVPPNTNVKVTAEQIAKAQKYCKWAGSALNYDDVKSAIENMEKGLYLLKTGQELQ